MGNKKGNVVKTTSIPERKGNIHIIANYSVDGDGTFHKKKGSGDYDCIQFNARTPSKIVATCAMEFGKKVGNYEEVLAYAIIDDEYENLVEDGTADKKFKVLNNGREVRNIEFKSQVKQIMSCRHHEGKAEADDIFIMLWSGIVYKVNGSKLMDANVDDKDLDMCVAARAESGDGDDSDDDDRGELDGFCVYNNRICVYGNDGLFAAQL